MSEVERKARLAALEKQVNSFGNFCPLDILMQYVDALDEEVKLLRAKPVSAAPDDE